MVDSPDADEIRSLIALSRQRPLSFGYCPGKTPDSSVLVMHRDRDPDAMARKARQLGESARIAFGTLSTQGRVVLIRCDGKPFSRAAKHLKGYLKSIGLKVTVKLANDAPDTTGDDAPDTAPDTSQHATDEWNAIRDDVETRAALTTHADPERAKKLTKALAFADRRARSGDLKAATKMLRKIDKAFESTG